MMGDDGPGRRVPTRPRRRRRRRLGRRWRHGRTEARPPWLCVPSSNARRSRSYWCSHCNMRWYAARIIIYVVVLTVDGGGGGTIARTVDARATTDVTADQLPVCIWPWPPPPPRGLTTRGPRNERGALARARFRGVASAVTINTVRATFFRHHTPSSYMQYDHDIIILFTQWSCFAVLLITLSNWRYYRICVS